MGGLLRSLYKDMAFWKGGCAVGRCSFEKRRIIAGWSISFCRMWFVGFARPIFNIVFVVTINHVFAAISNKSV